MRNAERHSRTIPNTHTRRISKRAKPTNCTISVRGSAYRNTADAKKKIRKKPACYENKPRKQMVRGAKLNAEKAKEIRRLYAAGNCTQQALAAKYHVSVSTVHCVISGRVWREVT